MELQNNRPAYLFVLAKKIEERAIFAQAAQQSDYAQKWAASKNPDTPFAAAVRSFPAKVRAVLPTRWKEAFRPLATHVSIRRRYSCYREIDENTLLRGEFAIEQTMK